jgi:hypothetical protein
VYLLACQKACENFECTLRGGSRSLDALEFALDYV